MTPDLEEAIWAVGLAAFEGGVRSPTHNAAEVELHAAIEAEFAKRIAAAPGVDDAIEALESAEFAAGLARWSGKPQDAAARAALLAAPGNLRAAIARQGGMAMTDAALDTAIVDLLHDRESNRLAANQDVLVVDAAESERRAALSVAALRTAIATHVEAEVARRQASAPGVEEALADLLGQVGCAAHHRDAMAGALRAAITAHVEAEVARRLAAAPGVEEAIEAVWRDCDHSARCGKEIADDDHSQGRRGSPGDQGDCDCAVAGHLATLRAAIAADRERAVEAGSLAALDEFRKLLPKYEPPRITASTGVVPVVADAEGRMLGGRREGLDTIYDQVKVPVARDKARPTPDEARRLVEEYRVAVDTLAAHCEKPYPAKAETFRLGRLAVDARDALLRALGVEA